MERTMKSIYSLIKRESSTFWQIMFDQRSPLLLLVGFMTLFNILGHQRRFRHRAWKVRQILDRLKFWLEVLLRAVNLQHGTHSFTSLPKEVILRIFTLWKNPSTPARIKPTYLGSRGEYDNHWTTGVDWTPLWGNG